MNITLTPVAYVKNSRKEPIDDGWAEIVSEIILADNMPTEVFNGILEFSYLEIIYYFDQVNDKDIIYSGYPRGNTSYPNVGIFAQRKKDRPNKIGVCVVNLVEQKERSLIVKYLDAIDATPILDIKPIFKEYLPKGTISQPKWVNHLMQKYW